MKYIIYYKNTGVIQSISDGDAPSPYDETYLNLLISDFGGINPNDFYIKNNVITAYPQKPDNLYKYNWNGENWVLDEEYQANLVKAQRDSLLTESDWVVTKAKEYDQEVSQEWKTYRQALRDITQQSGFPLSVVFPTKPSV